MKLLSGIFSAIRGISPFSGTPGPRQTEGAQQSKKADAVSADGRKHLISTASGKKTANELRAKLAANALAKAGEFKPLGRKPVGTMPSSASPTRRLGEQIRESSKPKAETLDVSNEINKGTSKAAQRNLLLIKSSILTLMQSLPSAPGKRAELDAALAQYQKLDASHPPDAKALGAYKKLHDDLLTRKNLRSVKSSILTLMESLPSTPGKRAELDAALAQYQKLDASHPPDAKALDAFKKLRDDFINGNIKPASSPNQRDGASPQAVNGKIEPASSPNQTDGEAFSR